MQQTRLFTLGFGIVYVLIGIIGFVPVFSSGPPHDAPHLDISTGYRYLFGAFPINAVHDLVHIVIGIAGVASAARFASARFFCRTLFLVYGAVCVLGFVPHADIVFGLMPIFGPDTWLHAASALAAGVFGFIVSEENVPAESVQHAH